MKSKYNEVINLIIDMHFKNKMTRKEISSELNIPYSTISEYIREIKIVEHKNYILLKDGRKLIWSNDEKLLSASSQGIGGYSNFWKNYTYRILNIELL